MGLAYDPREHAERLQVAVKYGVLPNGWRGAYSHLKHTIYLVEGMSRREERSTLAHEVAHAIAGDEFAKLDFFSIKQESHANLIASRALIDFKEYQNAERLHGGHIPSLAHELNVTELMIQYWQRWLGCNPSPFKPL